MGQLIENYQAKRLNRSTMTWGSTENGCWIFPWRLFAYHA